MRTSSIICSVISLLLPLSAIAVEPVNEPHAMVYYQVPFSGKASATRHGFGFRVDRATVSDDGMVDYHNMMQRPANLEFRMGYRGVQMLSIAGTDYAELYRVNRQNEETGDEEEQGSIFEDEGPTIGELLDDAPTGLLMGLVLGAVIISGVAN